MTDTDMYWINTGTGEVGATTLAFLEEKEILSTVLLADGSTMIQQATRDNKRRKDIALKVQSALKLNIAEDPNQQNSTGPSPVKKNPFGATLKKTTPKEIGFSAVGTLVYVHIGGTLGGQHQMGEMAKRDCADAGVIHYVEENGKKTDKIQEAIQDEQTKQDAINAFGEILHKAAGSHGAWKKQGAAHTEKLIGYQPAPVQEFKKNPSDQHSGSATTTDVSRTQVTTGTAAPITTQSPSTKVVVFRNKGQDPAMATAELYYESTRWGALGHGAADIQVESFPGHRWFIVANGVYAKQFTVNENSKQSFEI